MLKEPSHITLMTDIWTNVATQAYMTARVHVVKSKWELKTQSTFFPDNYTADNIGGKLKKFF